jgi:hypothetical protein
MQTVRLPRAPYFRDESALAALNDIVGVQTTLSPGLLMSYTGCELKDAIYVLLTLFEKGLVNGYFVIYDATNPEEAIERRHFSVGLPKLPYPYETEDGNRVIDRIDNLFYTLEFDVLDEVEFSNVG